VALGVGIGAEDVLVAEMRKPAVPQGGVEDGLVFSRGDDLDHEINDVARGAELAASPCEPRTLSRYSKASPRRSLWS